MGIDAYADEELHDLLLDPPAVMGVGNLCAFFLLTLAVYLHVRPDKAARSDPPATQPNAGSRANRDPVAVSRMRRTVTRAAARAFPPG